MAHRACKNLPDGTSTLNGVAREAVLGQNGGVLGQKGNRAAADCSVSGAAYSDTS